MGKSFPLAMHFIKLTGSATAQEWRCDVLGPRTLEDIHVMHPTILQMFQHTAGLLFFRPTRKISQVRSPCHAVQLLKIFVLNFFHVLNLIIFCLTFKNIRRLTSPGKHNSESLCRNKNQFAENSDCHKSNFFTHKQIFCLASKVSLFYLFTCHFWCPF